MAAELASSLIATTDERLLQAESAVRGYCGWHIAPERTETRTVRLPSDMSALVLPSLHVTGVASITRDGTLLVEGTDYIWADTGVLVFYTFPVRTAWSPDATTVTELVIVYSHGYAEVPPDVTSVVQAIAQRAVNAPDGRSVLQVGQVRYGDSSSSSEAECAILDRYRLPVLA